MALLAALVPGAAQALTILDATRTLRVTSSVFDPNPSDECYFGCFVRDSEVDPVGRGPWRATLALGTVSVSQASLIDGSELSGSASYSGFATPEDGGNSFYHVVFAVGVAKPYTFDVVNVGSGFPLEGHPGGSVNLNRVDPNDFGVVLASIYSVGLGRNPDTGEAAPDFSDEGTLAPGTYELIFQLGRLATHNVGEPATASFALVVVPEPGTGLLLGLGLLSLAVPRRRNFEHSWQRVRRSAQPQRGSPSRP